MWDTLAIGEFLNEIAPKAGLLPKDQAKRAHCRSICGEMHSGFVSLRQALPMNIKAHFPNFKIWSKAEARHRADQGDLARMPRRPMAALICSARSRWPTRCTRRWSAASAPTASRWTADSQAYAERIWELPAMEEWREAALAEEEEIEELEVEF